MLGKQYIYALEWRDYSVFHFVQLEFLSKHSYRACLQFPIFVSLIYQYLLSLNASLIISALSSRHNSPSPQILFSEHLSKLETALYHLPCFLFARYTPCIKLFYLACMVTFRKKFVGVFAWDLVSLSSFVKHMYFSFYKIYKFLKFKVTDSRKLICDWIDC